MAAGGIILDLILLFFSPSVTRWWFCAYFSDGLVQPPTRLMLVDYSRKSLSRNSKSHELQNHGLTPGTVYSGT